MWLEGALLALFDLHPQAAGTGVCFLFSMLWCGESLAGPALGAVRASTDVAAHELMRCMQRHSSCYSLTSLEVGRPNHPLAWPAAGKPL